jgi:glycosyltransferase involved in cell wall biosynthesis
MNILHVVHSFPPATMAGTEIYTANLAQALAGKHTVSVFYRINDRRKKEYEVTRGSFGEVVLYSINNTFRQCDSFEMTYKNKPIADAFGTLLDEIKPDIVHVQHLLFLSTTLIEEIKERNIPVLCTLHDYWLICQQGQFLKRGAHLCNERGHSECVGCLYYLLSLRGGVMRMYQFLREIMPNWLLQSVKKAYFYYARVTFLSRKSALSQIDARTEHSKEMCKKLDLFTAPSQFLRDKFIESGFPPEKIILNRYGLNSLLFSGFQRKKSEKLRFGYIGTLLPAKGAHVAIEAFNNIREHNVELKIYGSPVTYKGFEYYPRHIKNLVKNRNIRFMGGFDNKDIARIFSEIDVLVFPSIWHENCPLTIQEAFFTGTPAIASRIGGIPEVVEDGENGLLFEPGHVGQLQEKLETIIRNRVVLETLRKGIQEPKSIADNAREMELLYTKILAGNTII